MSFIYSLEFPEGNVRYIGKTNNIKKGTEGILTRSIHTFHIKIVG